MRCVNRLPGWLRGSREIAFSLPSEVLSEDLLSHYDPAGLDWSAANSCAEGEPKMARPSFPILTRQRDRTIVSTTRR
jgi:hypothetical protein